MDCLRGMFPFVHVPFLSNTSISDLFSCCLNCQPLGKLKNASANDSAKPSREIKTISSLVEKFTIGRDEKARQAEATPAYNNQPTSGFYRPCSRQTSFNQDMNHEKFTPCEKIQRKDWLQKTYMSQEDNNYGKININYEEDKQFNIIYPQKVPHKPKVAPPPRKKRPAPRRTENLDSRGNSQESVVERENLKNYRNLQMNNLNAPSEEFPTIKNCESNNNNCYTCKVNSGGFSSGSYVANNKLIKNNKSGCSQVAVASDNLESNVLQTFSKFDRNRCDAMNNNIIQGNIEADSCENKVYYKNSSFDKFGNYKHGNDPDEVIVCESYEKFHGKKSPERRMNAPPNRPKNSTYTKFYTDTFYQDHFGLTSSKSIDEPFEQIVQLQPEMAPFFQSALAMLKAKRALLDKQPGRPTQIQSHGGQQKEHRIVRRCSTEEDELMDEDDSIPVVICGLLPFHQLNDENWLQSVSRKTSAIEPPTENENCRIAASCTIFDQQSKSQDNKFGSRNSNQDVRVEIVGCVRKSPLTTDRSTSIDDASSGSCGATITEDVCQYAGMDKCEL